MMFLKDTHGFFEPYRSPADFASDLSTIIWDPICTLSNLAMHLSKFCAFSLPIAMGVLTYGAPLLVLLAFPLALNLLTLNIPIILAIAATVIFTAVAIHSMGQLIYDAVDLILSPLIDALRVITNLTATALVNTVPSLC